MMLQCSKCGRAFERTALSDLGGKTLCLPCRLREQISQFAPHTTKDAEEKK